MSIQADIVIGLVRSLTGTSFGINASLIDVALGLKKSEQSVDDQIKEAFESLTKSSALVEKLSGLLKAREEELKKVQTEYARVSALAEMTAPQAEAVLQSLQTTLNASAVKERIYAILINVVVGLFLFVLGFFASDWLRNLLA